MKAHSWWYGEGGIAALAISAVDMALWDIAAKDRGVPLYRLLGGAAHESLPACASLHVNHPTIEDSVAAIEGYIDGGFRSAKLGLAKRGLSKAGRDPDYDVALVGALRDAIGPEPGIMVDAGNGVKWDVETAVSTTRRMEEFGIEWMEEPLHPSDVAGPSGAEGENLHARLPPASANGASPATTAGSRAAPSTFSASTPPASRG